MTKLDDIEEKYSVDKNDALQSLISDEDLNKNFENILNYTKKTAIGKKDYMPELHIFTKSFEDFKKDKFSEALIVFADFPDTYKERCETMMGLGAQMAKEKDENGFSKIPLMVVFVSEMYFLEGVKEIPKGYKRIADMPTKKNGLVVVAMTIDKRYANATYEVIYGKDKKIVELKEKFYSPYKKESKDLTEANLLIPFWHSFAVAISANFEGGEE